MKKNVKYFVSGLIIMMSSCSLFAQVEKIEYFKAHVQKEVNSINDLADKNDIIHSVDKLKTLNAYLEHQISFNLKSEYIAARKQNSQIELCLELKLDPKLNTTYWANNLARLKKSKKLATEALEGIPAMRTLDDQDIFWNKLKITYRAINTIKDTYENLQSVNLYSLYNDLQEGSEGFIKDYVAMEEVMLQSQTTDLQEIQMKTLAKKAQKTIDKLEPLLNFMKVNAEQSEKFYRNMKQVNSICNDVKQGGYIEMVFGDNDYTWNYGIFLKEVEEECKEFVSHEYPCEEFKAKYNAINNKAEKDWKRVKNNVATSDDKKNKPFFLKEILAKWPEYHSLVESKFWKAYNQFCDLSHQDMPENTENTTTNQTQSTQQTTINPFEGAEADGDLEDDNKDEEVDEVEVEDEVEDDGDGDGDGEDEPITYTIQHQSGSVDKYWENTIPDHASNQYMIKGGEIEVRYQDQGRTVGYRMYKNYSDSKAPHRIYDEVPYRETVMNNCFLRHGPTREFDFIKSTGEYHIVSLSFYRAGLQTGPRVFWNRDSKEISGVEYYIDGEKISEQEYRNKARTDKNIAPEDIYKNESYKIIPFVNDIPHNLFVYGKQVSWYDLKIPADAFAKYYFNFSSKKSLQSFHEIYERFYLPDRKNGFKEVAERSWNIENGRCKIKSESITLGNKQIFRRWNTETGQIEFISFHVSDNEDLKNGMNKGYNTRITYRNNKITYSESYGHEITASEYQQMLQADPQNPPLGIYNHYMDHGLASTCLTTCKYPEWLNKPSLDVRFASDAKIWSGSIQHQTGVISMLFESNHMYAGSKSWYDVDMTKKREIDVRRDSHRIYSIFWNEAGSPKQADIVGKIGKFFTRIKWDDKGNFQELDLPGKMNEKGEEGWDFVTQNIPNIFQSSQINSSRFRQDLPPVKIPATEMTPLMREVMTTKAGSTVTPSTFVDGDHQSTNQETTPPSTDKQSSLMQELENLGGKIDHLITQSDEAFNKNYWEENQTPTKTQQATNPKKESYNLMHQATHLASQAKHPENKNVFHSILAYHLINYSGRVTSYVGKQEFINLAAQNLEKIPPLVQQFSISKREKAELYVGLAELWREMTRKALWGNHPNNKMYCDKKVMFYYEKAVQTDPTFEQAKKILTQLQAPKKPVPEAIKHEEPIAEEKWAIAQGGSEIIKNGDFMDPPDQGNPMELAAMHVNTGNSGKVWVRPSGTETWKIVDQPEIYLFSGDAIKTNSAVTDVYVRFTGDKVKLHIKPDAIVQFMQDYILIQRGDVMMQFEKRGDKFIVVTPEVGIGVRGTKFEVSVAPDKTTTTYLYNGVVELRNATEITYLTPGQKVTAKTNADQMQVETFNPQQRKQKRWPHSDDLFTAKINNTPTSETITSANHGVTTNTDIQADFSTYLFTDTNIASHIDNELNTGKTPIGIQVNGNNLDLMYIDNNIFKSTAWALDWYNSPNEFSAGVTSKMQNEGFFPMGFSLYDGKFYVLYIKGDTYATAWQMVESAQNLQSVSSDIDPWIEKGYIPVGISLHGDWYYTLLVQVQNSSFKNWEISGYRTPQEMQRAIHLKIKENMLPFGYIKSDGVFNVLYVGY